MSMMQQGSLPCSYYQGVSTAMVFNNDRSIVQIDRYHIRHVVDELAPVREKTKREKDARKKTMWWRSDAARC
jgi:hypothetical protein